MCTFVNILHSYGIAGYLSSISLMHSWCIAGHLILPSHQERAKTDKNFNSKKLTLKIKTILHFWRYTLHGDLSFIKALNMVKPLKNNYLYSLLYPISYIIYLIDLIFDKVEKTHIEFEKNIKIAKIKTEIFNK